MNLLVSLHPSRQLAAPDCHSRPAREAREELNTQKQPLVETQLATSLLATCQPASAGKRRCKQRLYENLPLRELEALAGTLLPVLLALFAARIPADHALSLQLLPQFGIELHQRTGDAKLHRIGLAAHAAAQHIGDDVKRRCGVRRRQRSFRRRTLRRSHEILFKRASVYFEIAAARTQIHPGNRRLAASCSVVLNQLCHLAFSSQSHL